MQLDDVFGSDCPYATFHDAKIEQITLDYVARNAILECIICVGDPNSPDEEAREARRRGRLAFQDLLYCVIEPPDPSYPYEVARGVSVTSDGPVGTDGVIGERLPSNLPDGAFAHYFFVTDWNAFIYIAAEKAIFEWAN